MHPQVRNGELGVGALANQLEITIASVILNSRVGCRLGCSLPWDLDLRPMWPKHQVQDIMS